MDYSKYKNTCFLFVVNSLKVFGGAERQALILAVYIKEHVSKQVVFLAFSDGGVFREMLEDNGLEVHCFPFQHQASKPKKILEYFKLIQFIKPLKPDVIIPYVAESNKIVAQIWKYTNAQFAFWNQREEGRKLFGSKLENKLIRQIPAIVSNSFEGKDALVKVYGLKDSQITVINNGIIPYGDKSTELNWHEKLDVDPNRPLIAMIANITDRKDHETLLKAWRKVVDWCKEQQKSVPFLILAGRKANTYDKLRLLGFDLKLSEDIAFIGEVNPVQPLIKNTLFCVFSSNLEGCPNGVLECMEQGKAVIGTNISGIRQALGGTYSKECFSQPNNLTDLANKIIGLYNNLDLIEEIGHYNRKRIQTEFSVKKMVDAHLKLIEEKMIFIK